MESLLCFISILHYLPIHIYFFVLKVFHVGFKFSFWTKISQKNDNINEHHPLSRVFLNKSIIFWNTKLLIHFLAFSQPDKKGIKSALNSICMALHEQNWLEWFCLCYRISVLMIYLHDRVIVAIVSSSWSTWTNFELIICCQR